MIDSRTTTRDTADIVRLLDIETLWSLDAALVRDLACPNSFTVNRNLNTVFGIVAFELAVRSL
jgi:hypothetical protein